jgi:signal transduction histidine kinase
VGRGDVVVPGIVALLVAVEAVGYGVEPFLPYLLLQCLACLLLVWRRGAPLVVGPVAGILALIPVLLGVPVNGPAMPVAVLGLSAFAAGRYVDDLRGVVVPVLLIAWLTATRPDPFDLSELAFASIMAVAPYALGRVVHRHDVLRAHLDEALATLRRRRAEDVEAAARRVRERIARDLHDIIAHSVSVMVVQAAAARDRVHSEPERAVAVLDEVTRVGREALAETGRVLALLRSTEEEGLEPQPRAGDLPRLVDRFRGAGLDVALEEHEVPPGLPPGVDVTVYRVAQEALTNALKHAPAGRTTMALRTGPDALDLSVLTQGGAPRRLDAEGGAGGYGLVGMRERVESVTGSLEAGPDATGGWRVLARFPVGGPA